MKKATLDSLISGGKVKLITSDCAVVNASALFACRESPSMLADAMTAYGKGCHAFISSHALPFDDAAVMITDDADRAAVYYANLLYGTDKLRFVTVKSQKGTTTAGLFLASLLSKLGVASVFVDSNGAVLTDSTTAFLTSNCAVDILRYIASTKAETVVLHYASPLADYVVCETIITDDVEAEVMSFGVKEHLPYTVLSVGDEIYTVRYPRTVAVNTASGAIKLARTMFAYDDVSKATVISHSRGRMQAIASPTACIIDSARTKADVSFLIRSYMEIYGTVTVVIGSVGGYYKERRREIAEAISDFPVHAIITTDDPCFEDAEAICDEIVSYLSDRTQAEIILKRAKAIAKAIEITPTDGAVLILGKGYENYQEIGLVKEPYSDIDTVLKLIPQK